MQYYGQFQPPVDKCIHQRFFPEKENGVAIEAGAFDGITESSTYFFNKYKKWTTYNIEPVPNVYNKLVENRKDPKSINVNIALSNKNDRQIIRNYKNPSLGYDWGNASINHTPEHKAYLEGLSNNTYVEHEVECMTYKSFIEKFNITNLDLFVLDVEGHEASVLEGMQGASVLPDVFVIEHGHKLIDLDAYFPGVYSLDFTSFVNSYFIKK